MYTMRLFYSLLLFFLYLNFGFTNAVDGQVANPRRPLNAGDNRIPKVEVQNNGGGKRKPKQVFLSIAGSQECGDDVRRFCGSKKYNPNNNFDILVCLTNNADNDGLSKECHQFLWDYKRNASQSSKFSKIAQDFCKQPLKELPQCAELIEKPGGELISCLTENKDSINIQSCLNFITKIQTVMFSDYHLICDFVEGCLSDIQKYKCGKLDLDKDTEDEESSQGEVVACLEDQLSNNTKALSDKCLHQMIRISELSADDYHLDRHVYFRCKQDRETFCADVAAGQGRVLDCLYKHKLDQQMSLKCRDALTTRQKVVAVDYKASYSLAHKCQADIKKRKCDVNLITNDAKKSGNVMSLSSIMLCLENSDSKQPLSDACEDELAEFRRMLMEDYELSPEITHHCGEDIRHRCGGGIEKEGKTIHCLMGLTQTEEGLREECQKAITQLLKETEPIADYRMDPVLTHACQSIIDSKCSKEKTDDSMVLACLMDHRYDKDMKKKCKNSLLELQYFVSRDFSLDPAFHKACRDEAKSQCEAYTNEATNEEDLGMVLMCLYNRIHPKLNSPNEVRPLSKKCEEEVHRVLKQRALDFRLNPELEKVCRRDLGEYCSDLSTEEGAEFVCLQDNFENLTKICREKIKELTQIESQNALDFDNILVRECEPMLQKYCKDLIDQDDEGKIMDCLIANKEKMESVKCAAGVSHFQIIEMKDYQLSYKFTKHCEIDVKKHCSNFKKKAEVVNCLSELVRNQVLSENHDKVPKVSENCRIEITAEKLQMHKNIDLNPELKKFCSSDYKSYCKNVNKGKAQVIECLREHKKKLKPLCYKHLFKFEAEESLNPNMDYQLMRKCKSDIREHCPEDLKTEDPQLIVECLIERKHKLLKSCRLIVTEREKEMFSDIELNNDLKTSCKGDIKRFCRNATKVAESAHDGNRDPNGVVYACLTDIFISQSKTKRLSDSCYRHVEFVIKEEDLDYELNPQLVMACSQSIEQHCPPKNNENVVKCLKKVFLENGLTKDVRCMLEVAKILQEGQSDIMADPVLHEACALDIQKHCSGVPEGHGRLITCLLEVSKTDLTKLDRECHDTLTKRQTMWLFANKQHPINGLSDVALIVIGSDNSTYLFSMLMLIFFLILCCGTVCGRATKRVTADRKMR